MDYFLKKILLPTLIIILFSCTNSLQDYPPELQACWQRLDSLFTAEDLGRITSEPESYMNNYHFSVGLTIRNNWIRQGDGKLHSYFNNLGITHPDDMSSIILNTYWCYKNSQPIELEERITLYKDYWESIHSNINHDDIFAPQ